MAIKDTTRTNQGGSQVNYHLTVCKNLADGGNDFRGRASFRQPVIPPAPLTGDVGRGCGDASRALLFSAGIKRKPPYRPTIRPTFRDRTACRILPKSPEIFVIRIAFADYPSRWLRELQSLRNGNAPFRALAPIL
jgi:hypothetical protein